MSKDTLEQTIKPHSSGPDSVLFGAGIKFGLGFELAQESPLLETYHPFSMIKCLVMRVLEEAVAFGDPEQNFGYGFICNQHNKPREMYKTNNQLTKALYSII